MDGVRTTMKKLLQANALFSAGSGLALTFGFVWLDGWFGLDAWVVVAVGLSLIGYGSALWLASRTRDPAVAVRFAAVMDFMWVLGAAVILIGFPTAMSSGGRLALFAVSLVVADLAFLQLRAIRRASLPAAGQRA